MRPRGNEFGVYPKKIHGSTIFYYWFYDKNGKRRFRSTGKRSFDEAVKFCRSLQIKGQLNNKTLSSFASYTNNFFDYENCPYINHRKARGYSYSRSWAQRQKRLLDTIITPHFGQQTLESITFLEIDKFILSLKNRNFSNKKINHIITTLKNIFSYAKLSNEIEIDPCIGIKPFKVISLEKGILSETELEKLFDKEKKEEIWPETMYYILNYLAAVTGMRLGEILALGPQDISNGMVTVSKSYSSMDGLKETKNGKSRIIPLESNLAVTLIDFCNGKQNDCYIFPNNNREKPVDHKSIYKRYYKALEKIGISKAERVQRNISFHSYRHGFNTKLLEAGVAPETVRLLTGHSISMTARYSHVQLSNIFKNFYCIKEGTESYIHTSAYLQTLIDEGLILPDGKTVAKSLNKIALSIQKQNIQPTEIMLQRMFLKRNGKPYSPKACKEAVIFANCE